MNGLTNDAGSSTNAATASPPAPPGAALAPIDMDVIIPVTPTVAALRRPVTLRPPMASLFSSAALPVAGGHLRHDNVVTHHNIRGRGHARPVRNRATRRTARARATGGGEHRRDRPTRHGHR